MSDYDSALDASLIRRALAITRDRADVLVELKAICSLEDEPLKRALQEPRLGLAAIGVLLDLFSLEGFEDQSGTANALGAEVQRLIAKLEENMERGSLEG